MDIVLLYKLKPKKLISLKLYSVEIYSCVNRLDSVSPSIEILILLLFNELCLFCDNIEAVLLAMCHFINNITNYKTTHYKYKMLILLYKKGIIRHLINLNIESLKI